MQWHKTAESDHKLRPRRRAFKRLDYKLVVCAYFLVPEGLHQPDCLLHRQREGEVRSWVNLWHLDVLVAEVPLPLRVPTNLVLSEDVRDQISWWEGQEFKLRDSVLQKEKKTQCVNQNGNLTFIARRCEIVHEVAEEIIKLQREETKRRWYFLSSLCGRQKHSRMW